MPIQRIITYKKHDFGFRPETVHCPNDYLLTKYSLCFSYPGLYIQYAFKPFQSKQDVFSIHCSPYEA